MIYVIIFVMEVRFIKSVVEMFIIFRCYFVVGILWYFGVVMVIMLVVVINVYIIYVLSFVLVKRCMLNVVFFFIILLGVFVVISV